MKINKNIILIILAGLLVLPSASAMQDCWELEDGECNYVNSFTQCHPSYYTEYYYCEDALEELQEQEKDENSTNYLQNLIELNFPDYEPKGIISFAYGLNNLELITFLTILLFLFLSLRHGSKNL